ncbi:MAG: hypothetical protein H6700_12315, partial [Myxococcales bacterium]|nr:hypothetical protein [Myxococcales bacterium]
PARLDDVVAVPEEAVVTTATLYGHSVLGRPLVAIKIAGPAPASGQRDAVLFMGVAQGGEHLQMVDRLPATLAAGVVDADATRAGVARDLPGVREFLARGGVIYAVPLVNPDGEAARTYVNANGVNLNRDWEAQTQPEISGLVDFLAEELQDANLRLVVDYHIGIPRLLYPRADSAQPLPFADFAEHMRFHDTLPTSIRKPPISLYDSIRDIYDASDRCDAPSDCHFSPRCDSDWNCGCLHNDEWEGGRCVMEPVDAVAIERHGLSNDYFYETYGAAAFVYEADTTADATNVEDHAIWWDRNLQYLATGALESSVEAEDLTIAPTQRLDVPRGLAR